MDSLQCFSTIDITYDTDRVGDKKVVLFTFSFSPFDMGKTSIPTKAVNIVVNFFAREKIITWTVLTVRQNYHPVKSGKWRAHSFCVFPRIWESERRGGERNGKMLRCMRRRLAKKLSVSKIENQQKILDCVCWPNFVCLVISPVYATNARGHSEDFVWCLIYHVMCVSSKFGLWRLIVHWTCYHQPQ